MTQATHSFEDKLLEFAYGELPAHEAKALEAHLSGCPKCSEALGSIRGVRQTMAKLPAEPAPGSGLESLLAYSEQAARRMAAGPAPQPQWWRKLIAPLAGVAALAVIGVVALETSKTTDLSPSKADYKVEGGRAELSKEGQAKDAPAQQALVPAAVAPAAPEAVPADESREEQRKGFAEKDGLQQVGRAAEFEAPKRIANKSAKMKGKAEEKKMEFAEAPAPVSAQAPAARPSPPPSAAPGAAAVGGLTGNMGERADRAPAEDAYDKNLDGRTAGPAAQMAMPAKEQSAAPSLGLSLGAERAGAAGKGASSGSYGGSSSYRQSPAPPAATSRAAENTRERSQLAAADTEIDSARQSSKFDQADRDQQQAVELRGLLEKARRVSSSDRSEEIRLAQEILRRDAKGYQRLEALKRLCDAYEALGQESEAARYCDAVVSEFPSSAAATQVKQRRQRPAAKRSKVNEFQFDDEAAKPAAAEPARAADQPATTAH
ncbi:MAG: zf-HC2 domain-containing protein [Myxococcaceae bacterium]